MSDNRTEGRILTAAGLTGATAVILGAYSAHGLENLLASTGLDPETLARRLSQFETGVRYHLIHALVLLGLAALPFGSSKTKQNASRLIMAGCFLFSGSLYLLVFLNLPVLGAITPLGGLSWILGWIWIARLGKATLKTHQ